MDRYKQLFVAIAVATLLSDEPDPVVKKRKIAERRYAVRPIHRNRMTTGFYAMYFVKMKQEDSQMFFKYTRMSVDLFDNLLALCVPYSKTRMFRRTNISLEERLAITLNYLSSGSNMISIAMNFHIGHTTVHCIIMEMCSAITQALQKEYLVVPKTEQDWLSISNGFLEKWQFPNCVGAIDGKHVQIQAPPKSGSSFFNYKKTFSIVLLASCDADYVFNLVDIGAYGAESDGGIFRKSAFGVKLDRKIMRIPAPTRLANSTILQPYTLVGDEAFPLNDYIMRPYPGRRLAAAERIFNYRLSRARRVIENAFGILVNRWRVMRNCIVADVKNVDSIVMTCVCLHNYLRMQSSTEYCPPGFIDNDETLGTWREDVTPLRSVGRLSANRAKKTVQKVRDDLRDYFMKDGEFPPQWRVLEL